jgi:hypothetical protein
MIQSPQPREKQNHIVIPLARTFFNSLLVVSAVNSTAVRGRKAAQIRGEIDFQIIINATAVSVAYSWLGRLQS